MTHNAFPFDQYGNFVTAAADISQCTDPYLLVSRYPFHTIPACTLPEGMEKRFSKIIGYPSGHDENSLVTESLNASISSNFPSAVEKLLTELGYTTPGEEDLFMVLPVKGGTQAPVGITTSHSNSYTDENMNEVTTLYSWSGEAALAYEKWINRVVSEYQLEVAEGEYNTYPHFGGRNGFLNAEPIFNALTKYAVSDNFLLTNRFENIKVVSAVDHQSVLNLKFSDGTFSIYGSSDWIGKYRKVSLSEHDSIASAAKDLNARFDVLDASITQANEQGRFHRALDYRVHVLACLPDKMGLVTTAEMPPLQMGIAVCELNEAIRFVVEHCSPDELERLPIRVRVQLQPLYEDRSPTVGEKIAAFKVSSASAGNLMTAMFRKKHHLEQKVASNDTFSEPSM